MNPNDARHCFVLHWANEKHFISLGIFDARAWLIPSDEASSGVVISCSGTGKPAPEVTWSSTVEFTAEPTERRVSNADGTFTVNSTLPLSDYSGSSIDCLLSSPGAGIQIKKVVILPGIVTPDEGKYIRIGCYKL